VRDARLDPDAPFGGQWEGRWTLSNGQEVAFREGVFLVEDKGAWRELGLLRDEKDAIVAATRGELGQRIFRPPFAGPYELTPPGRDGTQWVVSRINGVPEYKSRSRTNHPDDPGGMSIWLPDRPTREDLEAVFPAGFDPDRYPFREDPVVEVDQTPPPIEVEVPEAPRTDEKSEDGWAGKVLVNSTLRQPFYDITTPLEVLTTEQGKALDRYGRERIGQLRELLNDRLGPLSRGDVSESPELLNEVWALFEQARTLMDRLGMPVVNLDRKLRSVHDNLTQQAVATGLSFTGQAPVSEAPPLSANEEASFADIIDNLGTIGESDAVGRFDSLERQLVKLEADLAGVPADDNAQASQILGQMTSLLAQGSALARGLIDKIGYPSAKTLDDTLVQSYGRIQALAAKRGLSIAPLGAPAPDYSLLGPEIQGPLDEKMSEVAGPWAGADPRLAAAAQANMAAPLVAQFLNDRAGEAAPGIPNSPFANTGGWPPKRDTAPADATDPANPADPQPQPAGPTQPPFAPQPTAGGHPLSDLRDRSPVDPGMYGNGYGMGQREGGFLSGTGKILKGVGTTVKELAPAVLALGEGAVEAADPLSPILAAIMDPFGQGAGGAPGASRPTRRAA
jgi:hypothetical protein